MVVLSLHRMSLSIACCSFRFCSISDILAGQNHPRRHDWRGYDDRSSVCTAAVSFRQLLGSPDMYSEERCVSGLGTLCCCLDQVQFRSPDPRDIRHPCLPVLETCLEAEPVRHDLCPESGSSFSCRALHLLDSTTLAEHERARHRRTGGVATERRDAPRG